MSGADLRRLLTRSLAVVEKWFDASRSGTGEPSPEMVALRDDLRIALIGHPASPEEGRGLSLFFLTQEEITALACAVARSVEPGTTVDNAWDAANVVWAHRSQPDAGFLLTALATAFAEATPPPDPV